MTDIFVPTEEGYWVNEKHARLAEIIQDYNPEIELAWIPPTHRAFINEKPYAVVHKPRDLKPYIMFKMDEHEIDNPERVLARIFEGDLTKTDPLARMEAEERGRKLMELKAKMDLAEERQDFIASVVGSGKHYFKHNGRVIPT